MTWGYFAGLVVGVLVWMVVVKGVLEFFDWRDRRRVRRRVYR
jgi:hypothetical protein